MNEQELRWSNDAFFSLIFLVVFIAAGIIYSVVVSYHGKIIEHGCADYNQKTGDWQWIKHE